MTILYFSYPFRILSKILRTCVEFIFADICRVSSGDLNSWRIKLCNSNVQTSRFWRVQKCLYSETRKYRHQCPVCQKKWPKYRPRCLVRWAPLPCRSDRRSFADPLTSKRQQLILPNSCHDIYWVINLDPKPCSRKVWKRVLSPIQILVVNDTTTR